MSINLSGYSNITTALLLEIDIAGVTTYITDLGQSIVYGGNTYANFGTFMNITNTTSELRTTSDSITITISGLPNTSLTNFLNYRVKGSKVRVYRALVDASAAILPITGNPMGRFFGYVNNYTLDEQYDFRSQSATNTISIECTSLISVLENKYVGRRTNPTDQNKFYPSDLSMDRVPSLMKAEFQFGGSVA
jgi:hypothetical protein